MVSDERKRIFILSLLGRSGSTWLQRMLSSLPKVIVWGEPHGFINSIVQAKRELAHIRKKWDVSGLDGDSIRTDKFICNMQPPVNPKHWLRDSLELYYGRDANRINRPVWGVKCCIENADCAVDLQESYGDDALIIFLVRNPVAQARSWIAKGKLDLLDVYREFYPRMAESMLATMPKVRRVLIDYDELWSRPRKVLYPVLYFLNTNSTALTDTVIRTPVGRRHSDLMTEEHEAIIERECGPLYRKILTHDRIIL